MGGEVCHHQSGRRLREQNSVAPAMPDLPRRTHAPPHQFICRPRYRRRQQRLNPLGSTPPSSLEMGAGSSSAASKGRRDAPSSGTSALTQTSVPSAAHSLRIQDLEAQVRELKARPAPAPAPSPPPVSADATASSGSPPQLPPLDDSRMTPALATTAAALHARFTTASSNAQALMRTMRDIRMEWDLLPLMPSQSGMWHCCEMLPFTLHPAAAQHLTALASAQPPFRPSQ